MEENQLKPIGEQTKETIKPIEEKKDIKKEPVQKINKLPEWSLEPPLEINRSIK